MEVDQTSVSSRDVPVDQIIQQARELRDTFLREAREHASKRILRHFSAERERPTDSILLHGPAELGNLVFHDSVTRQRNDKLVHSDPASGILVLEGLEAMCRARRLTCTMPSVIVPPRYKAWVPTRSFHWITSLDEPFVPFLGDDNLKTSQELFDSMWKEYRSESAFELPSDGEIDEDESKGRKRTARQPGIDFHSIRLRAAQRHSILTIVLQYGERHSVWDALSRALKVRDVRRVKAVYDVAYKRSKESEGHRLRRERMKENDRQLLNEFRYASVRSTSPAPAFLHELPMPLNYADSLSGGAQEHYCSVCCEFACGLHDVNDKVLPLKPIADQNTIARVELLRENGAPPCSQRCFILEEWKQDPVDKNEYSPWTADEVSLLRDGIAMCERDPCMLSIVIGSRSCREVRAKMTEPAEAPWIGAMIRALRKPRICRPSSFYQEEVRKARRVAEAEKKGKNASNPRRGKGRKKRRARKSAVDHEETAAVIEHTPFVPCDHSGPCGVGNTRCTCFLKNLYCESRCGCNCSRLTDDNGTISWRSEKQFPDCEHKTRGCECRNGNCLDETSCVCAEYRVACNPDVCQCDCRLLRADGNTDSIRCKNLDATFAKHKRVLIGKSPYNMGLFAVDWFQPGDLVGVYTGVLMGNELADKTMVEHQAKSITFALNLLDDRTIDALSMGSKVKFVNHAGSAADGANCECHFRYVRGEANVALRATRTVKPGEEFYFNYRLSHPDGNEWLKKTSVGG